MHTFTHVYDGSETADLADESDRLNNVLRFKGFVDQYVSGDGRGRVEFRNIIKVAGQMGHMKETHKASNRQTLRTTSDQIRFE